jgi:hypothetical protein
MAEDSGTFKTNPAKSHQIQAFVIRRRRCRLAYTVGEKFARRQLAICSGNFSQALESRCGILELA